MQLVNSTTRYGAVPQALHWLTVIFVVAGWLLGQFIDDFPKGAPHATALWTHITLGQLVVVMLVVRLAWRIVNPPPAAEPTRFGRLIEIVSKSSHAALYLLLLAVPIVGTIVQLRGGHDLPILGFWHVASPWPADRARAESVLEVHEVLANALLILAAIHAGAALMHHYALGDRTVVRMLPARR